ncbi:hypothetical protein JCM10908_000871 [Rhodotorula pacifica]|uniref:uncharacterized protein n=1 Tax=Rhodotorula pacifica TaxID=1495444 RepID=UPI0031727DE1
MSASSSGTAQSPPGTFLTRFLGNLRSSNGTGNPNRPAMPRSLSSPAPLRYPGPSAEGDGPSTSQGHSASPASISTQTSASTLTPNGGGTPVGSLARRFKFRRSRSSLLEADSPESSPPRSPAVPLPPAAVTAVAAAATTPESVQLSPGSPATIRGKERNPIDTMFGSAAGSSAAALPGRPPVVGRRSSTKSQQTIVAHDHAYAAGFAPNTPLERIDEPSRHLHPHLDQSLELISTLLPPALLLLSQLGPTHLFSPPLQLPALFGVSLAGLTQREGSISTATGSNVLLSSAASIKSDATGSTTSASYFSAMPTATHVQPSHSHELHAPNTLSMPAVSAAALWRLFRGFEWIGEVGRGAQPLPPSVLPSSLGGEGAGPPQEIEDEPEQVFDFPSLLQGVADVLAADAAARGIELVVGQAGSGTAPSPAVTPSVNGGPSQPRAGPRKRKDVETRELLVRADERAWSVTLVWVLHHILAGAAAGSTVEVRFLATAATPPTSPAQSRPATPAEADLHSDLDALHARPQLWWNVSLDIVLSSPVVPSSPVSIDESASSTPPSLPAPPFSTPFARSLFSLIQLVMADTMQADAVTRSWSLEAMLPAARPKPPAEPEDPNTLLGRRHVRLEPVAGQEPTINDLKRFADSSLKGLKVALHAGETSAFAKHLTLYLAGWGMDVQHIPIESDIGSGGSRSSEASQSRSGSVPPTATRFDSGFETATTSPSTSSDGKASEFGIGVENGSNLVIIDDDVATLRRLLVSLRAPPLHYAPTLLAKRPQLASRRARSTPHVRQAPTPQQSSLPASQWVIVHFASLIDYKEIKEIVQDALAMSRQPNLPEVLVVPKPAGPRRIMTAIWSALKRPTVDPTLPPIATSPSSPGVKYWTPRLSPSLSKDREFDFSGGEEGTSSKGLSSGSPSSTKARTPPTTYGHMGGTNLPPSPLGKISDTADSYFSSVSEELKESTPSEGMIIQSPDGRSGIFFQPQPRARGSSFRERMRWVGGLERAPSMVAQQHIPEETPAELWNSSDPPTSVTVAAPHEIGLGSQPHSRRHSNSNVSVHTSPVETASSPPLPGPPGTPALTLDTFISAAKSRSLGEEPAEVANAGAGEPLSRTSSIRSPPPSRRSLSGSSAGGGTAPTPQRSTAGGLAPGAPSRQNSGGSSSPSTAPGASGVSSAAAEGAAAAQALAKSPPSSAAGAKARVKPSPISTMPRSRRRSSRRGTLPAVPPISVLIVEDNPINQTILSVFMKKKGITYKVAKDGQQAVDMWKKGNFHLVLMDIQLPVKSGIEATREIRAMERLNNVSMLVTTPTSDIGSPVSSTSSNPLSTPNSPLLNMPVIIVALTASSLQADRVAALAAGCNDFLTKPVSLPWLESKLVEWGSMAYLSGFSRRSDTSSEATSTGSAPSSRSGTPMRPRSRPRTPSKYTQGFASRADVVSQHLHIERPVSRAPSPSGLRSPDTTNSALPDVSPPPSAQLPEETPAPNGQPTFEVTSPTPQQTPHPVPALPQSAATPTAAAGGDAQDTLDRVEEVLETLVDEKPDGDGPASESAAHPPAPAATAGNKLGLDDVVAEGNRLLDVGVERSESAGLSQSGPPTGS